MSLHAGDRARSRGLKSETTNCGVHNFLDEAQTPSAYLTRAAKQHRQAFFGARDERLSDQDRRKVQKLTLYDMRPWWQKADDQGRMAGLGYDTSQSVDILLDLTKLRHERSLQCHEDRTRHFRKAFSHSTAEELARGASKELKTPRTHVEHVSATDVVQRKLLADAAKAQRQRSLLEEASERVVMGGSFSKRANSATEAPNNRKRVRFNHANGTLAAPPRSTADRLMDQVRKDKRHEADARAGFRIALPGDGEEQPTVGDEHDDDSRGEGFLPEHHDEKKVGLQEQQNVTCQVPTRHLLTSQAALMEAINVRRERAALGRSNKTAAWWQNSTGAIPQRFVRNVPSEDALEMMKPSL